MEESKDKQTSQQKAPVGESKPAAPVPATAPTPQVQTAPARPPVAPKPPVAQAPAAPKPVPPKDGRRSFMKALLVVGAILAMVPFVPWGTFLSSTVVATATRTLTQRITIDDLADKYGSAAGKDVNVKDLSTFPPNSHWVVTYPTSGHLDLDAQNPDTFLKYELIRLPESLGGANKKATDFVAFSKVCVHLWCSPNYVPSTGNQDYECPCHGSKYRVPDGKAYAGPASLQAFPSNAIPMLTLLADSDGFLYAYYPNTDPKKTTVSDKGVVSLAQVDPIEGNGELGTGRDFNSYNTFIQPSASVTADPKWAKDPVGQ